MKTTIICAALVLGGLAACSDDSSTTTAEVCDYVENLDVMHADFAGPLAKFESFNVEVGVGRPLAAVVPTREEDPSFLQTTYALIDGGLEPLEQRLIPFADYMTSLLAAPINRDVDAVIVGVRQAVARSCSALLTGCLTDVECGFIFEPHSRISSPSFGGPRHVDSHSCPPQAREAL